MSKQTENDLEQRIETIEKAMIVRLEGAWTDEMIAAASGPIKARILEDPEALADKYPDRTPEEAFELEVTEQVYNLPRPEKIHVPDLDYTRSEIILTQNECRQSRAERRPATTSRSRGRSRRPSSNGRRKGSRRTARRATSSTAGGSRGDPDGDPDPSDPGDRDRRETKGRYCLGCGAGIDPARRADARYCPGSACRKAYVRRGRVPAEPLVPDSPDLVGSIRSSMKSRDRQEAIARFRQSIRRSPEMAHRYCRDLGPAIDALLQEAAHEYRKERAALLAGRVER